MRIIITLLILFLAPATFAQDLLLFRISLPIKKSKESKVQQVVYDMWGTKAEQYSKASKMSATNWADSGWMYFISVDDAKSTSAVYCVTMKQTDNRGTEAKRNEWKGLIDGGMDADIIQTNSLKGALDFWKLTFITNGVPK